MAHPLLDREAIDRSPEVYLRGAGELFALFARGQDSGNHSYGVAVAGERFFVKSAGPPDQPHPVLTHAGRVALLRNAARLHATFRHPLLPALRRVIESPHGPLLVYDWATGELLGVPRARRDHPASAFQRFRALPAPEIRRCLDAIFELHARLAAAGWIACDFYDGCLIYDFAAGRLAVIDLDTYHQGPFRNTMGRMFGSTRFMAPEEFELGAPIDERTTVFTMGRTALVLLSDGSLDPRAFRGPPSLYEVAARACEPERDRRYESLAAFYQAWRNH
jgi:serine/threonine-protein kinase